MSAELERQLLEAFERLPDPSADAEARALRAALAALPPQRHHWRRAVLVATAMVAVLAGVTAALAATGAVEIHVSAPKPERRAARSLPPQSPRLLLPPRTAAIGAVLGGEFWVTTAAGTRIERLPVTAAALSPRGLYFALGSGGRLLAMAPSGRTAWSLAVGGDVAAVSWSPDGLRVAYVVRRGRGFELHLVEGDGDNPVALDTRVRPVRPAWRDDALAFAYVTAGGRAAIYDFSRRSRRAVAGRCAAGVTDLAFAPHGARLAATTRRSLVISQAGRTRCTELPGRPAGPGWTSGAVLAVGTNATTAGGDASIRTFVVPPNGVPLRDTETSLGARLRRLTSAAGAVPYAVENDHGGTDVALVFLDELLPPVTQVTPSRVLLSSARLRHVALLEAR